jgi:hypothetical protein
VIVVAVTTTTTIIVSNGGKTRNFTLKKNMQKAENWLFIAKHKALPFRYPMPKRRLLPQIDRQ